MLKIDRNTEIRHLPSPVTFNIAKHLRFNWKNFMSLIPRDLNNDGSFENTKKYSNNSIELIETYSNIRKDLPAIILFEEWGTSGKIRPTLGHLYNILVQAEFFQVADYIAADVLKEKLPERPKVGPAARIDITLEDELDTQPKTEETILNELSREERGNSGMNEIINNQNISNAKGYSDINKVPLQEISLHTEAETEDEISTPLNEEILLVQELIPEIINTRSNNTSEIPISNNGLQEINSNFLPQMSLLEMKESEQQFNTSQHHSVLSTENSYRPDLSLFNYSISQTQNQVTQAHNNDVLLPDISLLQLDTNSINSDSYIPKVLDSMSSIHSDSNASIHRSEMHVSLMSQSNGNFLPNLSELYINSRSSESYPSFQMPNLSVFGENSENIDNSFQLAHIPATLYSSSLSQSEVLSENNVTEFSYEDLKIATNNFNKNSLNENGRKLGSGAFSDVFLAINLTSNIKYCAVKRLHPNQNKYLEKFYIEIEYLSKSVHKNIVKLFGYSKNNTELCLVYEYISGGNLYEKLKKCREKMENFNWIKRIHYSYEIINGIKFLHDINIIHRDIKTTNILLNNDVPIICDFGLIKDINSMITTNVSGTSCYMSPESIRGSISTKTDVYAFGVVLLELITGLDVYDKTRSETDLVTYFETISHESDYVGILTDWSAGDWNKKIVSKELFDIASLCLKSIKIERPSINDIKIKLDDIYNKYC